MDCERMGNSGGEEDKAREISKEGQKINGDDGEAMMKGKVEGFEK